jgi:hypothetical protein
VLVDQLDVVVYQCRSLERQISAARIPLLGCSSSDAVIPAVIIKEVPDACEAAAVQVTTI